MVQRQRFEQRRLPGGGRRARRATRLPADRGGRPGLVGPPRHSPGRGSRPAAPARVRRSRSALPASSWTTSPSCDWWSTSSGGTCSCTTVIWTCTRLMRGPSPRKWMWHQDGGIQNHDLETHPRPRMSVKVAYFLTDVGEPGRGNFSVLPGSHMGDTIDRPPGRRQRPGGRRPRPRATRDGGPVRPSRSGTCVARTVRR